MSVNEKLITVDHLKHIRNHVNCAIESNNEELYTYISQQLANLESRLNVNIGNECGSIEDRLEALEEFFDQNNESDDNSAELNDIRSQLNVLSEEVSNKNTVLSTLRTQLSELNANQNELSEQVESGSIFNSVELQNIIDTSLIDKTTITEDMVEAPNVYTSNLVSLIAKFGEVKANNIIGEEISGKTIKSTDDKWELTSTGAGKLANGNITWTADGVVTFSDNVELKWGNITGAPTIPEAGVTETQVNNLIATQITNSGITADTIEGKTIKQHGENPKWSLNSDGSGHLGKFGDTKSIEWNADGIKIQGENVEIAGDVKINGAAIITGITGDTSAQESFNTMVANCIDATEIKTDVLETKPDDTDKVHIEDNYIHCITKTGDKSLIISSNDVDPGELDTLFNPNAIINDKMPTDILFDATTTYNGAQYACNGSLWRSGDGIQDKELTVNYGYDNNEPINIKTSGSKLGYIYKSGIITANISLTLHEGNSVEFNPMNPKRVSLTNWNIAQGAPITDGWGINNNGTIIYPATSPVLPTTYIVGGGDSSGGAIYPSNVIGRILIYRADANNGIYYKYRDMTISGIDKGWTNTGVGQARTLTINNIEIWDPGYYAIELCFNPNSFILLTSTTATNKNYCMHGGVTTTIVQDAPADYMKIGKNGLVAFNGSTGFSIDDNNITMRARNNNNFYGIKIAPAGIYIGDGNTTWKRLDTTKLFSLLASAE